MNLKLNFLDEHVQRKIFLLTLSKHFIYVYVHILVCFYVHHVYVDAGDSDKRAWEIL